MVVVRRFCVLVLSISAAACGPTAEAIGLALLFDDDPSKPDPLVTIEDGPAPIVSDDTVTFTFSTNRNDLVFEVRTKRIGEPDPDFVVAPNPFVLTGLLDGEYELTVRVRAGQRESQQTRRFVVDTTPPEIPGDLTSPVGPRIASIGDTVLTLLWDAASDLGSGVVAYEIYYTTTPVSPEATAEAFDGAGAIVLGIVQDSPARIGAVTATAVSGLRPCTRIFIAVAVVDGAGNRSRLVQAESRRTTCRGNGRFVRARDVDVGTNGPPRAILAADFDGDRSLDLAALPGAILLGNGDGTFTSLPLATAPDTADDLDAADLNADGILDIVTSGQFLQGDGDGTFTTLPETAPGEVLVLDDFTGDGVVDALVLDTTANLAEQEPIKIRRGFTEDGIGRGNADFGPPVPAGLIGDPGASVTVVTADFNGDSILDAAVARQDPRVDVVLGLGAGGRGNGLFGDAIELGTGDAATALLAADLDRDGIQDLVAVTGSGSGALRVFFGNRTAEDRGDGTFGSPFVITTGTAPTSVVTGDFNADGIPDLAVSNRGSNDVHVFLGGGEGGIPDRTFRRDATYTVGDGPRDLAVGDFDEDTILDLATANADGTVTILLGLGGGARGSGTFEPADGVFPADQEITTSLVPRDIQAVRADGDPVYDLALAGDAGPEDAEGLPGISLFRGRGFGGQGIGTFDGGVVFRVASSGDARSDTNRTVTGLATGDFDEDGILDFATIRGREDFDTFQAALALNVFRGAGENGRGTGALGLPQRTALDDRTNLDVDDGRSLLTSGDLNRDGITDLLIQIRDRRTGPALRGLGGTGSEGSGDGGFTSLPRSARFGEEEICAGDERRAQVLLDFDRDGVLDVAAVDQACDRIRVWKGEAAEPGVGNARFAFQQDIVLADGAAPAHIVAGDFNGDTVLDLAVALSGPGTVQIFLGQTTLVDGAAKPNGMFEAGTSATAAAGAFHLATGDFNADRITDLAVACPAAGSVAVLLGGGTDGKGDGTFALDRAYAVGTDPAIIVAFDANADGVLDFAVADRTERRIRILFGVPQ